MNKGNRLFKRIVTIITVLSLVLLMGYTDDFMVQTAQAKTAKTVSKKTVSAKKKTAKTVSKKKAAKKTTKQTQADNKVTPTTAPTTAQSSNPEDIFKNIKLSTSYKTVGNHNPLITQRLTADPWAMEYNGRVYVYTTNDIIEKDASGKVIDNSYSKINTLNCFSSDDLVNWTDHGTIQVAGPTGTAKWGSNSWAPAACHKTINGKEKFFIYYANGGNGIGVLTSDSPVGPFTDPIGKALISRATPNCSNVTWLFDPAVLIDTDGKAYLYCGGGVPDGQDESPKTARVVQLGDDMTSIVGEPKAIDAPYLFEDSGINKIGNTYYYSYCSNWADRSKAVGKDKPQAANIAYMTSDSPMGPFKYQGTILKNPGSYFGTWGNNHHCMIQFKNKWYMFYHSFVLQVAMGMKTGGYRSTHVDEVTVNADGSIAPINATKTGVSQLSNFDPYKVTEAETFSNMAGLSTAAISEASTTYGSVNMAVTDISDGDWSEVSGVDFGNEAPKTFTAKVASKLEGNYIKICADKADGQCLGYVKIPNTGSEDKYQEVKADITGITGVHDLYFVYAGKGFKFDSWSFGK